MSNLSKLAIWSQLTKHAKYMQSTSMSELFLRSPERGEQYNIEAAGIYADFSKNLIELETISLLVGLAEERDVTEKIEAMFRGKLVNKTENRAALHTRLRDRKNALKEKFGELKIDGIENNLSQIEKFSASIRNNS